MRTAKSLCRRPRLRHATAPAIAALCLALPGTLVSAPVITEFLAANDRALYDEDGQSSDWIEIHNPAEAAADLGGYFLTNDAGDLEGWRFPEVSLPPGGYLVVFASGKDRDVGELHTDFRLSRAGGFLALVEPDGVSVVSGYSGYPEQFDDISYGLAQAGTGEKVTLLAEDATCKVFVPTRSIGTEWRTFGFDDDPWNTATTGVGYERSSGYRGFFGVDGDIGQEMYETNSSFYLRIPFSVGDPASLTRLVLRMRYDDGFVASLNGIRIAAANAPANMAWNSAATQTNDDRAAVRFQAFRADSQIGHLRVGENVLAIHGLNESQTSSDFLIQARLVIGESGEGGEGENTAVAYTGPITLGATARIVARVFDPGGGQQPGSGTPVGTGWSVPLKLEYLVDEVPAGSTNLVISEIMADPYEPADQSVDDGAPEFIELVNISVTTVSLSGLRSVEGIQFAFEDSEVLSLGAGEHVVLVRDLAAFTQVYGGARAPRVAGEFFWGRSTTTVGGSNWSTPPARWCRPSPQEGWPTGAGHRGSPGVGGRLRTGAPVTSRRRNWLTRPCPGPVRTPTPTGWATC